MTRAAIVTPNFSLGGAERWVNQLLQFVPRIEWTGLCISGFGGADPLLSKTAAKYTKIHTHVVPPSRRPVKSHPFRLDLADVELHDDLVQAIAATVADADVVLTWGYLQADAWRMEKKIPRICCSHATATEPAPRRPVVGITHLAAVSEAAMTFFDERDGGEGLPRQVIYNGCELAHVLPTCSRTEQRDRWGVTAEKVIGHIGRHSPEKNYMALATSSQYLPSDFRVVYYGRDQFNYFSPAADLLEAAATSGGRILCFMPEPRIGDILHGMDAIVIASHFEACSLAMLEAWFAGTPVVATPVGSVPELQRKFGELVIEVPRDPSPQQLAEACEIAVSDKGRAIATKAMQIAHEHFTIERMANSWADYLESIC